MSGPSIAFTALFALFALVHAARFVRVARLGARGDAWAELVTTVLAGGMAAMFAAPEMRPGALWAAGYGVVALSVAVEISVRARRHGFRATAPRCGSVGCGACMAYMFAIGAAGVPGLSLGLALCCGLYGAGWMVVGLRRSSPLRRAVPQLVMGIGMAYMLAVATPGRAPAPVVVHHAPSPMAGMRM